jgi:hypothetical protein
LSMPSFFNNTDVRVYHPHGILPYRNPLAASNGIVLTQADYDRIVGDSKDSWRMKLIDIFQSRTCLFIGLSGADKNLSSILCEVNNIHPAIKRGDCYWGIKFSDNCSDSYTTKWEERGVYQLNLPNYDQLPGFLLSICQLASESYRIR